MNCSKTKELGTKSHLLVFVILKVELVERNSKKWHSLASNLEVIETQVSVKNLGFCHVCGSELG